MLEDAGRAEEALQPLTKACELAPHEYRPLLALARCLVSLGRAAEAEKKLREALSAQGSTDKVLWDTWVETALRHSKYPIRDILENIPVSKRNGVNTFAGDFQAILDHLVHEGGFRINCGVAVGTKDSEGREWLKDCFYHGRSEARLVGGGSRAWRGGQDAAEYTERVFRELGGRYSIPLPDGVYDLHLWIPLRAGDGEMPRHFDVEVEGVERLLGVMYKEGEPEILMQKIESVNVNDGWLDIVFVRRRGFSAISAIEIKRE